MKLHLDKNLSSDPDWKDLIGKHVNDVDVIVHQKWQYPWETIAIGYNHLRCKTYQYGTAKAVLILDESKCVLDVFVYDIGQDKPDNSHTWF